MNNWISVHDKLPQIECDCLVFGNNTVDIGRATPFYFPEISFVTFYSTRINEKDITHWMALPEPLKEDK